MEPNEPTAVFRDRSFKNTIVDVDGRSFINCTFTDCGIRYSASNPRVGLTGCTFTRCHFVFDGSATNTIEFLKAIYHGMDAWGRGSVEKLFDEIRKPIP